MYCYLPLLLFWVPSEHAQAELERFTPLLRGMIGSGLGACEVLATIRRDNPRTYVVVTPKRIQEVGNLPGLHQSLGAAAIDPDVAVRRQQSRPLLSFVCSHDDVVRMTADRRG